MRIGDGFLVGFPSFFGGLSDFSFFFICGFLHFFHLFPHFFFLHGFFDLFFLLMGFIILSFFFLLAVCQSFLAMGFIAGFSIRLL